MTHSEHTKLLRLPLVPTWVSYRDAVLALIVITRMIHWLEHQYGNPYAWAGNFLVRNKPPDFFPSWGQRVTGYIPLAKWTKAFFGNLSEPDQDVVRKRLKGDLTKYLDKPPIRFHRRNGKNLSMLDDLVERKPAFLRQPPPSKWIPVKRVKSPTEAPDKELSKQQ